MRTKLLALLCIVALLLGACGQTAPNAPASGDHSGAQQESSAEEIQSEAESDKVAGADDQQAADQNTQDGQGETTVPEKESENEPEKEPESEVTSEPAQPEGPWEPSPAPAVRQTISEEDKAAAQKAILDKGTFLFSGKMNEGYYPSDVSWLKNASEDDMVAILYTCENESHAGWGILGIEIYVNYNYKKLADVNAASDQPKKERLLYYTVKDLLSMSGASSVSEFTGFSVGAWSDGKITGIYHLPSGPAKELKDHFANIEETEKIIHTYDGDLSNENAIPSAVAVYEYLKEVWGTACLTGQMESTWMGSPDYEMNFIKDNTGKLPVIRGLDFMHNDFDGVVKRSIDWWEKGGIPTICWHTGADFASGYNESLADNINWEEAFVPGSKTNLDLIEGMDRAVPYLQQLEDEGVPVLWRPFHELDGGWFWWSKGGSENFVKLWQMMYSRYTDYWGLDNLIWVYGYTSSKVEMDAWYPGDDYVDLVGADSYDPGANGDTYEVLEGIGPEGMPIVFHECGTIPTEKQMKKADAPWLFFMVWHTDHLTNGEFNSKKSLNEIYNSDYFITLDELPKFE